MTAFDARAAEVRTDARHHNPHTYESPTGGMSKIETDLTDRVDSFLDRVVEQGDFVNREQAVEELLTMGLSAFDTPGGSGTEPDDLFSQTVNDQQDPAARMDDGDDYGF